MTISKVRKPNNNIEESARQIDYGQNWQGHLFKLSLNHTLPTIHTKFNIDLQELRFKKYGKTDGLLESTAPNCPYAILHLGVYITVVLY